MGDVGPVGPVGDVGPVGPVGDVGAVGPVGPVGEVGAVGPVAPVAAGGVPVGMKLVGCGRGTSHPRTSMGAITARVRPMEGSSGTVCVIATKAGASCE
ncbi:MAG: hypothetical protein IT381_17765 [Deltaproteobacteria bacterium]|nr:hypothetical protein [Deltaproteobacteria bacterium]